MTFDFSALLVALVAVSGFVMAFDALLLAPKRPVRRTEPLPTDDTDFSDQPILVQYARSFFPIFLLVLLLRSFLVEPFRIPSGSMMPTLLIGDFILVNKFNYGIRLPVLNTKVLEFGKPKRGDVIVFRYPEDPSTPYIKRVIGVPGDHVVYNNKELKINNQLIAAKPIGSFDGVGSGANMSGEDVLDEALGDVQHQILIDTRMRSRDVDATIPMDQYFVMGDNRDNSKDSRYWGTVPDANLIGRAFMIWMNWDGAGGGVDWHRIGNAIR
jgi:signal peptidase I